ncbi:putative DnaJ-like protein [Bacillus phage vB_BspM_MarvelLand]|nr:putative DnaJ-like protein [Bacillus phage vB_BspM_MarvelLand]
MVKCGSCKGAGRIMVSLDDSVLCKLCKGTGELPIQVKMDCVSGDGYYAKLKLEQVSNEADQHVEIEVFRPYDGKKEQRVSHIALNLPLLELTLDYLKRGGE